ncbi:hypothetical protein B0H11DRAFT_1903788 [Mycena galericulata]|nr:hypothetical protein B0H11DRAFT_1903788 [Mycena galericulata]
MKRTLLGEENESASGISELFKWGTVKCFNWGAAWLSGNQQSWSLSNSEITGPREIEGSNPGKAAFRRVLVGITNLGRVPHCSAFAVHFLRDSKIDHEFQELNFRITEHLQPTHSLPPLIIYD